MREYREQKMSLPNDIENGVNSSISGSHGHSIDSTRTDEIVLIIQTYYIPFIIFTGSLGNVLSVIVFSKTKLKKLSSSYYLAALAVSDTGFLIVLMFNWLSGLEVHLYNKPIWCQFFQFSSAVFIFLSVWFVVAFTVERFIAVMYPLKRQTMCTIRRAKIVLSALLICGIIFCSPVLVFSSVIWDDNKKMYQCDLLAEYKDNYYIYNGVDTVFVLCIPLATIAIVNTFTGWTVWRFGNVRRKMTSHKRKPAEYTTSMNPLDNEIIITSQNSFILNCSHPNRNNLTFSRSTKRKQFANTSQLKVTKMLLIVSTVFVILNLPSYVMRIYFHLEGQNNDGEEKSSTFLFIQYITNFLFVTNFGINFVLYCVSGQNFRRALLNLYKKGPNSFKEPTINTQVSVTDYFKASTSSRKKLTHANESFCYDFQEIKALTK